MSLLEALALVVLAAVAYGAALWIVDGRAVQEDDAFIARRHYELGNLTDSRRQLRRVK